MKLFHYLRENGSVESEGLALVSLLQTCLNHNLRPNIPDAAPPHAKIAADIVACIFLVSVLVKYQKLRINLQTLAMKNTVHITAIMGLFCSTL